MFWGIIIIIVIALFVIGSCGVAHEEQSSWRNINKMAKELEKKNKENKK